MSTVMGIHPESRVLRSRTRTGESTEWWSPDLNRPMGMENALGFERRIVQASRFRIRFTKIKIFFVMAVGSLIFFGYMRFIRLDSDPGRATTKPGIQQNQMKGRISKEMKTYDLTVRPNVAPESSLRTPPKRLWRYPLVDRKILEKLDRMQEFFDDDYSLFPLAVKSAADSRFRWPPLVTSIPERVSRPSSNEIKPDDGSNAICESAKHPRPCRFLLPLRIAEQESKARLHFSQIAHLAKRLNRTLVLPNVGKSKIGTCFKWPFSMYYDSASLNDTGTVDGLDSFVDLELFRLWVDNRDRRRKGPPKSQLVSIASGLPVGSALRKDAIHSNEDVSSYAYSTFGAWERELPGCFSSRFDNLKLETRPIFMSATSQVKKDGTIKPIGNSLVDAFSAISPGPSRAEPAVLVVNWDLRYPVFAPSLSDRPLEYSTRMTDLALKYAPKDPYLVVQWRMETVDVEILKDCAHALVDVLGRVLGDHALAGNVTTVWFASDYPYPIANDGDRRPPAVAAKSGTFKDFEVRHEEAIEILRTAFRHQGELERWKLTDFAEATEGDKNTPTAELIQDSGVTGILDKIVSTKADLFVSGSTRCSRRSSFTKQVIDARREKSRRNVQSHLKNIVDIFG